MCADTAHCAPLEAQLAFASGITAAQTAVFSLLPDSVGQPSKTAMHVSNSTNLPSEGKVYAGRHGFWEALDRPVVSQPL